MCNNNTRGDIHISWVLLSNQSIVNIFSNNQLLTYIKTTGKWMKYHCNAGITKTNMIGKIKVFPEDVWYHPKRIVNILSMVKVENYFPVTYGKVKFFIIHKNDFTKSKFIKYTQGIYYLDTNRINIPTNKYRKFTYKYQEGKGIS